MSEKIDLGLVKKYEYAWDKYSESDLKDVFSFSERYKKFMSQCKTERECVTEFINIAEEYGFKNLDDLIKNKTSLNSGDKVYYNNKDKSVVFYIVGEEPIEKGLNILGAHIDSPRIDLKQNPLYEESDLALFETHYYGGIKKYQWVAIPLAIHGTVIKKDGSKVNIVIGEDDNDPVFNISDLLIHLSGDQMAKTASKVIDGEAMNLLVGSIPIKNKDEKNRVKMNILQIIKDKYDIDEEDFVSSEIELVPSGKARDLGLDRSMVIAYGQDDRICAYTGFEAICNINKPRKTVALILADKEEVGSIGNTGMHGRFFENSLSEIMNLKGEYNEIHLRRALSNSKMLSADVTAAFDPNFPSVAEKRNAAYFGKGLVFSKYTGSRGKSGCNDANAEFMGELRNIMNNNNVSWQTSELGKVDQGGGGTIAYILAQYGMEVIDCGVALQNMHAPWEVSSKADIYETYRGYEAFLREA